MRSRGRGSGLLAPLALAVLIIAFLHMNLICAQLAAEFGVSAILMLIRVLADLRYRGSARRERMRGDGQ